MLSNLAIFEIASKPLRMARIKITEKNPDGHSGLAEIVDLDFQTEPAYIYVEHIIKYKDLDLKKIDHKIGDEFDCTLEKHTEPILTIINERAPVIRAGGGAAAIEKPYKTYPLDGDEEEETGPIKGARIARVIYFVGINFVLGKF